MATKTGTVAESAVNEIETPKPISIFALIPRIREEVGAVRKDQQAVGGARYNYRGADTVINALVPVLNKYGVFTTVSDSEYTHVESVAANGKIVTIVTLKKTVRFYAPDGSYVESEVYGENSDYSDKATGGASTYAYRYALLQTFTLPTDEPDSEGKEPIEREAAQQSTVKAGPTPEEEERTRIEEGKNAIKKLAADKGLDYLAIAREIDLPANYASSVTHLSTLYKELDKREAAV